MDVAFWARKFRGIFDFDQDNKVEVVPHIVFHTSVLLKCDVLVVKSFSFQT